MPAKSVKELETVSENVKPVVEAAIEQGAGCLRLSPNWVPRSFMHTGKRL